MLIEIFEKDKYLNKTILIEVLKKYNDMVKKEVIFQRKIKIQTLNRVVLSPELLENMDLKIGDEVSVFFDTEKEEIIIRGEE